MFKQISCLENAFLRKAMSFRTNYLGLFFAISVTTPLVANEPDMHSEIGLIDTLITASEDMYYACDENPRKIMLEEERFINIGEKLSILSIPNYLCHSNAFLPLANKNGTYRFEKILEGEFSSLHIGKHSPLYIVAHWSIGGTTPIIYSSLDGISWKIIKLPDGRAHACCFEQITMSYIRDNYLVIEIYSTNEGTGQDQTELWEYHATSSSWNKFTKRD